MAFDLINTPTAQYNAPGSSSTTDGNWASLIDENGYVFIALVSPAYRPRLSNTLLYSLKNEFYRCNPSASVSTLDQVSIKGDFLPGLADRFNDPSQWDKLSQAQQKVELVKGQLQENLKKITENRDVMIVRFCAAKNRLE